MPNIDLRIRPRRTRLALTVGAVAATLLTAFPPGALAGPRDTVRPTSATTQLSGLRVLLVNDDSAHARDLQIGTDGKGLYELRKALCAAGADVLTVAPWAQQSGSGARMTAPGFKPVPLTVQAVAPPTEYAGDCSGTTSAGHVFGVCQAASPCTSTSPSASPADAVNVTLSAFAKTHWDRGPDVVVSGVNFGQNVGTTLNHSGTVGAVVTAHEYGIPALAFSAEVPRDLTQIARVPFSDTAAFAVRLIRRLVAEEALDKDLLLNVNHPFVGAGETLGRPVATVAGRSSDPGLRFDGAVTADGGTYQLSPGPATPETRERADTTALAANHISVSTMDGDWTRAYPDFGLLAVLGALR